MKKGWVKSISGLLIVILVMLSFGNVGMAAEEIENPEILVEGDYQYSALEDGSVQIVKYTGHSSEVRIPEQLGGKKVTVIGESAFEDNKSINVVFFSKYINRIGICAFMECSNLHYLHLNEGLRVLEGSCLARCDLYELDFPKTVEKMGQFLLLDNNNLKKAKFLGGPSLLGNYLFYCCSKLETIEFAEDMRYVIGVGTFTNCASFKGFISKQSFINKSNYIIIPNQVSWIGKEGFRDCSSVEKVVILNANCGMSEKCIDPKVEIYGVKDSEAQKFAEKYNYKFIEFNQLNQISLSHTNIDLEATASQRLTVTYSPSNATIKEVMWTSSNPKVATVDQSGNIKAISNGTATITARTFDESNLKQECKVTVGPVLKEFKLNKQEVYLDLSSKKSEYIKVETTPSNIKLDRIAWKSSDNKIASIDSKGKIYAKGVGKATISATINGREKKCIVYVAPQQVQNLKVNTATYNSIKISWNGVKNASGYRVYIWNQKNKKYECIGDYSNKSTSCLISNVKGKKLTGGKEYGIRVCAYKTIDNKKVNSVGKDIQGYTVPYKTKIQSLKRIKNRKNIKASWKRVNEASYYEVWVSTNRNKGYKCMKKTNATACTIKNLSKKKRYYIKVRVVTNVNRKTVKSKYSSVVSS